MNKNEPNKKVVTDQPHTLLLFAKNFSDTFTDFSLKMLLKTQNIKQFRKIIKFIHILQLFVFVFT